MTFAQYRRIIRRLVIAATLALGFLAILYVIVGGAWGYGRLWADFIPLDHSSVGPNLCASIFLGALMIAHGEFRAIEAELAKGAGARGIIDDVLAEAEHPVREAIERADADVAADHS